MDHDLLLIAILGVVGASLSAGYIWCERWRREPWIHVATLLLLGAATAVCLLGTPDPASGAGWGIYFAGTRFLAFLTAGMLSVPALVYILMHLWGVILERILHPGSRREAAPGPQTPKELWLAANRALDILAEQPGNVRARLTLAGLYDRLGYFDSAANEYQKAAEWMDGGYHHAWALYKSAYLVATKKNNVAKAIPTLRRIVRLYPKSYFAGYARRLINHWESRREETGSEAREDPKRTR